MNNDKKVVLSKVNSVIMETIWFVLMIVAILVFVAEDMTGVAILVGVGAMACIGMIVNEVIGIKIWLNIMEEDSTVIINSEENK